MRQSRQTIRTPQQLPAALRLIERIVESQGVPKSGLEIIVQPASTKRTLAQNALAHVWYAEISRVTGEDTPEGVRRECKLRFGVPILRADVPGFRETYDALVKPAPYEAKLEAMDWLNVTSIMSVNQLTEYLDHIQKTYADRVQLEAA